jgi:hypothetical protein
MLSEIRKPIEKEKLQKNDYQVLKSGTRFNVFLKA